MGSAPPHSGRAGEGGACCVQASCIVQSAHQLGGLGWLPMRERQAICIGITAASSGLISGNSSTVSVSCPGASAAQLSTVAQCIDSFGMVGATSGCNTSLVMSGHLRGQACAVLSCSEHLIDPAHAAVPPADSHHDSCL